MKTFDDLYLDLVVELLESGEWQSNRTGIDTLYKIGVYWEIDMADGFPLLTTKKMPWKAAFAEQLGFLRGYSSAADFRRLGCRVWDANANRNPQWLRNPNRQGEDDLGRIYGVQGRRWAAPDESIVDQLWNVYLSLLKGVDDRRLVVTHWNPGELNQMALPPCHMMYTFSLRENNEVLDLFLYVRSNDVGLGMPFNVAQYAFLLHAMAKISGRKPGRLLYFAQNAHIYKNHIEALEEQLLRTPKRPPDLVLAEECNSLDFLVETEKPISEWCQIEHYDPHPAIKMEMAV